MNETTAIDDWKLIDSISFFDYFKDYLSERVDDDFIKEINHRAINGIPMKGTGEFDDKLVNAFIFFKSFMDGKRDAMAFLNSYNITFSESRQLAILDLKTGIKGMSADMDLVDIIGMKENIDVMEMLGGKGRVIHFLYF